MPLPNQDLWGCKLGLSTVKRAQCAVPVVKGSQLMTPLGRLHFHKVQWLTNWENDPSPRKHLRALHPPPAHRPFPIVAHRRIDRIDLIADYIFTTLC